jgi:glycosyltransferase involved in cell wall biosynthesis
MKILKVINSLGTGGAEKLLLETLPLYHKNSIEMDILLLWDNNCMFTSKLKELDCCKVLVLNKSKNLKLIYNPLNIFKIARVIKNYDIAHIHLFPAQYFSVLANMLTGNKCKLIFTEHNTSNRRIANVFFKPIELFFYKRYTKIITISTEIEEIYKNYLSLDDSKVEMINNGVSLEGIFEANVIEKKNLNKSLTKNDLLIVQVSAFRPQKDQKTLIRAIKELDNRFKLILVGDGVTINDHKLLVQDLGLKDRVLFLGQRDDVNNILKSASVVVLSSLYEGLSLASIEGLASGKPFIASNVPGLSEIVKGFGLLFEQGNVNELVRIINDVIDDKHLYDNVVEKCLIRAKEFNIDKMIKKHISLYREVYAKA